MPADLQTIVQRMLDAGEPEESIADVIREYPSQASPGASSPVTPGVLAGVGAMKLAPGVVSMAHAGAKALSAVDPVVTSIAGSSIPHVGAAIGAAAPKVASVVAKGTAPLSGVTSTGAKWAMKAGKGPLLTRGAGWLSRAAGAMSMPLSLTSGVHDLAAMVLAQQQDPNTDPRQAALLQELLDRAADPNSLR